MAVATVVFRKCILNPGDFGSDDQDVGCRVVFDLEFSGEHHRDLSVDVKQVVGRGVGEAQVDVSWPRGYHGPFNFLVFQELLRFYYLNVVGAPSLLMGGRFFQDYTLTPEMRVQFEVESGEG